MFCRKCGNELKEGAKFCTVCGAPVQQAQPQRQAQPQVQRQEQAQPQIQPQMQRQERAQRQERPQMQRQEQAQRQARPQVQPPQPAKGGNAAIKALIAGLCVLLAAIVGIVIWLVASFYEKPAESDDAFFENPSESSDATEAQDTSAEESRTDAEETESRTDAEETESTAADASDSDAEEDTSTEEPAATLGDDSIDADAIHNYKIVTGDVTWLQAFRSSLNYENGYLAHINSQEEMDYIADLIEQQGYGSYIFWIGAKREKDGREYHWVDSNMHLVGDSLNHEPDWLRIVADDGTVTQEPSFWGDQNEDETCVDMFQRNGEWVWNDVQNDLPALNVYNGKIGYIVEME